MNTRNNTEFLNKTITHQNINGLRTNTAEKVHVLKQAYIISIQDTRLKLGQDMLETLFPDHITHEIKHDQNTGIAILVHKSIRHTLISKFNQEGHKAITIKITDNKIFHSDLFITSYFVPPHNSRHRSLLNTDLIREAMNHKHALITGDFNARHMDIGCRGTNLHGKKLHKLMLDTDYTILNDTSEATFIHTAHNFTDCLDYAIATKHLLPFITACHTTTDTGSDHLPLTTMLQRQKSNLPQQNKEHTLNYKQTNWASFTEQLRNSTEATITAKITTKQDLEQQADLLIQTTQAALLANTPRYRAANHSHPRLPSATLRLIKTRRTLKKLQLTENSDQLRTEINELNKAIKQSIRTTKQKIEQDKTDIIKQGPRHSRFWPTLKSLTNPTSRFQTSIKHNGQTITTPLDKAEAFTEHYRTLFTETQEPSTQENFHKLITSQLPSMDLTSVRNAEHPLTKLITMAELTQTLKTTSNNSAPGPDRITYEVIKHFPSNTLHKLMNIYNAVLDTAHIPLSFKSSILTLIPKPHKDHSKLTSYRPITLTSTLGKLLEKIIARRLNSYATQKQIIKNFQTGFRPQHDAAENTIHLIQTTIQAFNQNKCKLLISVDLQQAFDRTWHTGALHTILQCTDFHFTKIIHSFLSNRRINIRIENTLAPNTIEPSRGVPQGSPLSPILFNIFLSTAPSALTPDTFMYNYADDFNFTSTATNPKQAWLQLKPIIDNYTTWTEKYKLKLQAEKTQAIFFTRKRAIRDTEYPTCIVQGTPIQRSTNTKILGAHFDIHLTMKQHIEHINTGTHHKINQIRHILTKNKKIPSYIGTLLYKTLIRTKFLYATPILLHIKPTSWRPLQITENKAMRAALRTGIRTKIETMHKRTRITPIIEHYKNQGQQTLLRFVKNKNKTLLSTLFNTNRAKNIAFWQPPLDNTFQQLTQADQAFIHNKIQTILADP